MDTLLRNERKESQHIKEENKRLKEELGSEREMNNYLQHQIEEAVRNSLSYKIQEERILLKEQEIYDLKLNLQRIQKQNEIAEAKFVKFFNYEYECTNLEQSTLR